MKNIFHDDFTEDVNFDNNWQSLNFGINSQPSDFHIKRQNNQLELFPKDTNPQTGQPMFTRDIPQQILLGQMDHMKFSLIAQNSRSKTSFTVPDSGSLNIEANVGGEIYGLNNQPFGKYVKSPESDFRLGTNVLMVMDPESMMVFDFFITNKMIYAVYEHGKSMDVKNGAASFSYAIPLKKRDTNDMNKLRISYSKSKDIATWFIDDKELFHVDNVGLLIDRQFMTIDNGGQAKIVKIQQLNAGFGIFSLMDGAIDGQGLINLVGDDSYYDPLQGEPHAARFLDNQSLRANRLFGQGAKLIATNFVVFSEQGE